MPMKRSKSRRLQVLPGPHSARRQARRTVVGLSEVPCIRAGDRDARDVQVRRACAGQRHFSCPAGGVDHLIAERYADRGETH